MEIISPQMWNRWKWFCVAMRDDLCAADDPASGRWMRRTADDSPRFISGVRPGVPVDCLITSRLDCVTLVRKMKRVNFLWNVRKAKRLSCIFSARDLCTSLFQMYQGLFRRRKKVLSYPILFFIIQRLALDPWISKKSSNWTLWKRSP